MRTYHEELGRHMKKLDMEAAQARESLEERKLQYERLRLKSREYFRKNERDEWKQTLSSLEPDAVYQEPCEEEIELELLRRKESLKGGDKP